jgi:hypothetical protein
MLHLEHFPLFWQSHIGGFSSHSHGSTSPQHPEGSGSGSMILDFEKWLVSHWMHASCFSKFSKYVQWAKHMTVAYDVSFLWATSHAEVSLHMLQLWGFRHLHSLWTGADVHPSAQSAGQCLLELKSMRWDGNHKVIMICSFFLIFLCIFIFLAGIEKCKLYSIYGYFRGLTMAFRGLLPVCV